LTVGRAVGESPTGVRSAKFPQTSIIGFPNPVTLPSAIEKAFTVDRAQEGAAIRIILSDDILFDFDKSELRRDAEAHLSKFFDVHRDDLFGRSIVIEGHTDNIGSDAYNQWLLKARTIGSWLGRQPGFDARRVVELGFGESRPRSSNFHADGSDDPFGRQRNRRVEIIVRQ
jgi:outer membrane protein OmpA-like peptidoglycan-associated protein